MPVTSPSSQSLIPATQQNPGNVRRIAQGFVSGTGQSSDPSLWTNNGQALQSVQDQLDKIWTVLQQSIPTPDPIQVVDPNGALIAEIGDMVDPSNNTAYQGIWVNNLYAGGSGPATAELIVTPSGIAVNNVTITETGSGGTIVISPTQPEILLTSNVSGNPTITITPAGTYGPEILLQGTGGCEILITIFGSLQPEISVYGGTGNGGSTISPEEITIQGTGAGNSPQIQIENQSILIVNSLDQQTFKLTSNNAQNACTALFENGAATISVLIDTTGTTNIAMNVLGGVLNMASGGAAIAQLAYEGVAILNNSALLCAALINSSNSGYLVVSNSSGIGQITASGLTGNLNLTGVYQQNGTSGISATATLRALTLAGSNGSITFAGGIATAYTAPT
jgi:hypothetical protein